MTADGGDQTDTYDVDAATLPAAVTMNLNDSGGTGTDDFNVDAANQLLTFTLTGNKAANYQESGHGLIQTSSISGYQITPTNWASAGVDFVVARSSTFSSLQTTTFSASGGFTSVGGDNISNVEINQTLLHSMTVDGTSDPDSVVVDLTGGNPLPTGLTYSGGTGGSNSLKVENGSITTLTYNATGVGAAT